MKHLEVSETAPLATPPSAETVEPFVRWALATLARLTRTPLAEGPLEPDGVRGHATDLVVRRGPDVVARITRFDDAGRVHGIDVGVGSLVLDWRSARHARSFVVRGGLASIELARLRAELRATEAPLLVRPSLLARMIASEAREVGSALSELDHGGGAAAWDRIARAGAIGRAALAIVPEACASAGLTRLDAFAASPSSVWSELDHATPFEAAPLEDACAALALAPRAIDLARAVASTALTTIPADHPLRAALAALRDAGDAAPLDVALRAQP